MISCFHCGLAVTEPGKHRALLLGAQRELCCAGCEAVARTAQPQVLPSLANYDDEVPGNEATLIVERVRCAACLWLVEQTMRRLPGVTRAEVNYATQRAQVAWDPERIRLSSILQSVRAVGYDAYPYDPRRREALERRERRTALWRLFVAAFGAMQVMMYAFPAYMDDTLSSETAMLMRWASLLLTLPVLVFSCAPFFSGARREMRQRRIGLDTPIALGLAGGFIASAWATVTGSGEVYFDSISMLAFLLLGARYIETGARRRTAAMLDPLLRWTAERKVCVNEELQVAPGERVPADGIVVSGASSADESLLTGESRPVAKRPGDELVGGSVNLEQPLVMRVTRAGADTRAAAIARLVERAAATRPRLVEAGERIARNLTYVVIVVALSAWAYWGSPWVAVAVLVATCPCALALAAPLVLTRASATLLGLGALLTRTRALESLERVTDVVLDKTGTLTTGRLAVARFVPLGRLDERACVALAQSLEATSRHPVARAFGGSSLVPVESPQHFPGQGIEARVDGRLVRIGKERFCQELCGTPPPGPCHPNFDTSWVFLADEQGWIAAFELEDNLRPAAAELVAALKKANLTVHLASGDRLEVGAALARQLWIESFAGDMTPRDKYEYVARLQREGRVVAMVGDGLNDAPVLACADVSFAMGAGCDAAKLQADVVLTGDRLASILDTLAVARGAMHLVRQNLGWALAYNALALPLAATGWIGPWEAALGMGASSLIVLLNALRPVVVDKTWKASTSSSPSPSPSYS
jgi:Cu2+-exporting ATPase